jgi:hypothetical protein
MTEPIEITAGMATAAALAGCEHCHGFGSRPVRFGKFVVCNCALRRIFRACLVKYREVTETVGHYYGATCMEVFQGHSHLGLGYGNKGAEFRADVELTARRVLTPPQLEIFTLHFVGGMDWHVCCARLKLDRGNFFHKVYVVQEKMGRALAEAGVYPTRSYFSGCFIESSQVGRCHTRTAV